MKSKLKVKNHITENKSLDIIRKKLPVYWTIREYKPDYGIDLGVEIFDEISSEKHDVLYETLGEHIFIQVKGTEKLSVGTYNILKEFNVEKKRVNTEELEVHKSIEVIKFNLETSELYTIERMSSSLPVFLFVVDIISEDIYFLCLNDYIDKVISPREPNYYSKKSKTIYIPKKNIVDKKGIDIIKLYAKRPKLYAFFIKVEYQNQELMYKIDEELSDYYGYFIEKLLKIDIWELKDVWHPLKNIHTKLTKLMTGETKIEFLKKFDNNIREFETNYSSSLLTKYEANFYNYIRQLWKEMSNLLCVYEEDSREWFLPTYFNTIISEN